MTHYTLYHNPACSKSRAALELLESRAIAAEVIHYLDTPLCESAISILLDKLGISARELLRSKEAIFKELGLDDPQLDEAALIKAMAQHPILIERPILADAKRAVIGRPTENLLELLP